MDYVVRDAPEGVRAHWFVSDGVLIIEVSPNLDRFTRQQYIDQALTEHPDATNRRRNRLLPVLPFPHGSHAAGLANIATTVSVAGGVVAVGVAAALVLPAVFDDGKAPVRPPSAAAPARPTPLPRNHPPSSLPSKPSHLDPRTPPPSASRGVPVDVRLPLRATTQSAPHLPDVPAVPHLHMPHLPAKAPPPVRVPPVTHPARPLLAVALPSASTRVAVNRDLSVGIRLDGARLGLQP